MANEKSVKTAWSVLGLIQHFCQMVFVVHLQIHNVTIQVRQCFWIYEVIFYFVFRSDVGVKQKWKELKR